MSERRQMGIKDFLYVAAAIGGLGSLGWLFKIANAVEEGRDAKAKIIAIEPRLYAVESKEAVLESKVDYIVNTLSKIDRRMERDRR